MIFFKWYCLSNISKQLNIKKKKIEIPIERKLFKEVLAGLLKNDTCEGEDGGDACGQGELVVDIPSEGGTISAAASSPSTTNHNSQSQPPVITGTLMFFHDF